MRGRFPRALLLVLLALSAAAPSVGAQPGTAQARVLVFTSPRCPHCARVRSELVPALRARFGDRLDLRVWEITEPPHYEALMAIEDAHRVPAAQRVVPIAVLGTRRFVGAEAIEAELGDAIAASLADGGNPWPPAVDVDASAAPAARPADADAAPIWMAYFYQTGCRACSRAEADLAWLRDRHPNVRIEEHNVYDDAPLGFWLAERADRELGTPAVFIGDRALIGGDEVNARALDALVERYQPGGAPRFWADFEADAADGVVARFRDLGPAAVVAAGLVDGINPCAFATLIFFVSYLSVSGRRGKAVLAAGGAFTLGVFLAYLAVGLGLYRALDALGGALADAGRALMLATALVCAAFAVLSFRDYLRARRGQLKDMTLTLPEGLRSRIRAVIRRGKGARFYVPTAFGTGLVVSLLELACTGQVYLPTIVFVTTVPELRGAAIGYLLLYNALFVLPLVVVFVLVYFGTTSQQLTGWLKRHAQRVKLGLTAFFALLALWLVLAAIGF